MTEPATTPPFAISQPVVLSEHEIIEFARQFDPQPYHLDRTAGDASIFGGLCASGWQVASLATRLVADALLAAGHPFVDITAVSNMRWKRPSFANDSIAAEIRLKEHRRGSVIPGCDTFNLDVIVVNDGGDVLAEMQCSAAIDHGISTNSVTDASVQGGVS